MRLRFRKISLVVLVSILLAGTASAGSGFLVDGLHGLSMASLDSIYPEFQFTHFTAERLPLVDVLTEGYVNGWSQVSIYVDVPADVPALYVDLTSGGRVNPQPLGQYPYINIVLPDQRVETGAYGVAHVDHPQEGTYEVQISLVGPAPVFYRIGAGPMIWEQYPLSDYRALLKCYNPVMALFTGPSPNYSATDSLYLDEAVHSGISMGLFYDGAEPIAMKPIIHMSGMAGNGAVVRLDLPGYPTYTVPEPFNKQPLVWKVPPTAGDVELDYEARFWKPLNFIWRVPGSNEISNVSWATARDVHLIEYVPGAGYRLSAVGTLEPNSKRVAQPPALLNFSAVCAELDRLLRREALEAGLTAQETSTFFDNYKWARRVVARASKEPGAVALYRLEAADYDALFPLTITPAPESSRRVIWIDALLPDRVTEIAAAHPALPVPQATSPAREGVYHEYGFFRETYAGDVLDDLDAWGWHFYDSPLGDTSDVCYSQWGQPFDFCANTWGSSPAVAALSQGVESVWAAVSGAIGIPAGPSETVLSGDEDTWCVEAFPQCPFEQGSFPPLVAARSVEHGGRILGAADLAFLTDYEHNLTFGRNMLNWLHTDAPEEEPDIDIPRAVALGTVTESGTASDHLTVFNRGQTALNYQSVPPAVNWLEVSGPPNVALQPGDSMVYLLNWNSAGLAPGSYYSWWQFASNDPNEPTLHWPVRLTVLRPQAAGPNDPSALTTDFRLNAPYPNPFNPTTRISFSVPKSGDVSLRVFDVLGREVAVLLDQHMKSGEHFVMFDAAGLASGVYFTRLETSGMQRVQKMVVMK